MSDLRVCVFKLKFFFAALISTAFMLSSAFLLYEEIAGGIDGKAFYMCFEFYVHAVIFLFFLSCLTGGAAQYNRGEKESIKTLLRPFYVVFSLFLPSKQAAGFGAAVFLFAAAVVIVAKLFL